MKPAAPAMGVQEWLLLFLLSLLWGGAFFYYKVLDQSLPPLTVVLGRVGLAALVMNLFLIAKRDPMPLSPGLWARFLVLGFLNSALPFSLFAWSELRLSSGLAAILNATTPVFAVLVAAGLRNGEQMTLTRALAVAFGFVGVVVLIGPEVLVSHSWANLPSEVACLVASLSYGFGGFYGRSLAGATPFRLTPFKMATGQITGAALIMLPLAAVVDRFWRFPMPGPHAWAALAGSALLATVLAYAVYFGLLPRAGVTNLMLVTFLVPISALVLASLMLHERLAPGAFAGMALIGLSLAAIDGRLPAALLGRPRLARRPIP